MQFTNNKLTTPQLQIAREFIPHLVVGSSLTFESKIQISSTLDNLRIEKLQLVGGKLRTINCLIRKIELMLKAPEGFERPVSYAAPKKKIQKHSEMAISCTIQQTEWLRDHLSIPHVRWASDIAAKTEMLINRDHQAAVVDHLRQAYAAERIRSRKRIISTVIHKLGGDVRRKSLPDITSPKRSLLMYVCDVCDVEVNRKATTLKDMIDVEDVPVLCYELRKMGSMVTNTLRVTTQLRESLEAMTLIRPKKPQEPMKVVAIKEAIMEPTAADLQSIEEFAAEIEQDEISQSEMDELMAEMYHDPLAAGMNKKVEVDYSELDHEKPFIRSPEERYQTWDDTSMEIQPDKDQEWQEDSWGDLEDYDDDAYDDEDGDPLIISSMVNTIAYFGIDELQMYGALDWEDEQVIFAEEEDRDAFCDAITHIIDGEIASGKLSGQQQDDVEREVRILSNAMPL